MSAPAATWSLSVELASDLSATSGTTASVIGPFTAEALHDVPLSSARDVVDAVASARVSQVTWRAATPAHRRKVLLTAHDLLLERKEAILDLVQLETGKARGSAFEELFACAVVTRYYALTAKRVLATRRRGAAIPFVFQTRVSYRPKGIIGVITPWNFPIALGVMDIIPALAAGNGVVQKIDTQTTMSMLAVRRAYIDAGVPAALWAIVAGPGDIVGNAVVDTCDYVCFTGSTPTGTSVGVRAAGRLIGASLELGGKNSLIVLDDVSPATAAANAVYSCFSSLGQLCVSIERIFVDRGVSDAFTTAFVSQVNALTQGSALDYSTDVGSLTSAAQLARVTAQVDDAVAHGARVLTGGHARPELGPYFFAPTVLTGVTPDMQLFAHETFGPVVSITVVSSENEAIAATNATAFGLNASIFSGSRRRARRLADLIDTGSVNLNEGYRASFGSIDAPMGGMKQSGLGRRNGREGILRFVDARTVAEATGLMTLPRTGKEFARLAPVLMALARTFKAIRRA